MMEDLIRELVKKNFELSELKGKVEALRNLAARESYISKDTVLSILEIKEKDE